jgi:hypothetical protein
MKTSCDEFCASNGCVQANDCPVRKAPTCPHCYSLGYDASGYTCTCVTAAEVAKVGRKYHDREPLRGKPWRRHLRDLAAVMLVCIAVMIVSGLVVMAMTKT